MKKNGEFVGVDEKYVPEDEKYVDESFLGKNKKIPKFVKILIGGVIGIYITILITVFITIIIGVFLTMGLSFKITNIASEGFDFIFDQIKNNMNGEDFNINNKESAKSFNFEFSIIEGESVFADINLSKIITNNKTNHEHIIMVVYKDKCATTEDDILSIKKLLEKNKAYYYSLGYDENGYINKVTIKDI